MNRRQVLKALLTIGTVGFTAPLVCAKSGIPKDWHSHQCNRCSTVWSHGLGVVISHNCPKCGTFQNIVLNNEIGKINLNSINPYPPGFQIAVPIEPPTKPIVKPLLNKSNFGIFGQGQLKH